MWKPCFKINWRMNGVIWKITIKETKGIFIWARESIFSSWKKIWMGLSLHECFITLFGRTHATVCVCTKNYHHTKKWNKKWKLNGSHEVLYTMYFMLYIQCTRWYNYIQCITLYQCIKLCQIYYVCVVCFITVA
jgi:hypothetical protein